MRSVEDAADIIVASSPFTQIYDKTLLSIQECIGAYEHSQQQQQQQQQQSSSSSSSSKVVYIDGSWYHKPDPTTGLFRNPSQEYSLGPRLPNARYIDIDSIASSNELFGPTGVNPKLLPHMMPPPKLFNLCMDAYNIQNNDHIIVYAKRGALFTPRVWFLFVSLGHDPKRVHLMQGSLEDYIEEGVGVGVVDTTSLIQSDLDADGDNTQQQQDKDDAYATMGRDYIDCFDNGILNVSRLYYKHYDNTTTTKSYKSTDSTAKNVCGKEEVLDAVNQYLQHDGNGDYTNSNESSSTRNNTIIIDTRGSGYTKNGHIPSAIHLPYSQIATPDNALTIQTKSALKKLFDDRGINYLDDRKKIILTCGSGV